MNTIQLTEILEYYDGIQIFAAHDPIGGHYVCSMIDTVGDFDRYLVVGVRPDRLDDFRIGKVDLRTLLLESPDGEWYTTVAEGTINDPLTLVQQKEPLVQTDYLPEGGFFLAEPPPVAESDIRRAIELGNVVTLTGRVELADRSAGEWRLLTESGVQMGRTAPGGTVLDGLQVGKRYHFQCAEITAVDPLWQDQRVLYLQKAEAT